MPPEAPVGGFAGEESSTFAERLNHLFETVHPAGRPYTYEQVSQGCADLGYEISTAYLWQLRQGRKTNPTLQHIQGIAAFFGVPVSYFFDPGEAKAVDKQLDLLAAMRDKGVKNLAMRAMELGEEQIAMLTGVIESLPTTGKEPGKKKRRKSTGNT